MNVEYVLQIFFISLVIIFVLRQVSGLNLSFIKLLLLTLLSTIVHSVSPLFGFVLTPFYLMFIEYFYSTSKSKFFSFFCGIYALSVEALFTRFILFYLLPIFRDKLEHNILFFICLELLLIPSHYIFVKVLRLDYGKLKKLTNQLRKKLLIPFIISMSVYNIAMNVLIIGELIPVWPNTLFIRQYLTLIFSLIFLCLMLGINYTMTEELDKEAQSLKDQQLASLSSYSKHVEALYREIRSFRHDYTNILVSLNESIRQEDIAQIRQVYDTVIADTDKKFYDRKYDIASLANVKDDAIKSILSAKLIEAQKQGIGISVEVEHEVALKNIDLLDFITILSIFLDNAIEAAKLSANPEILLAYFEEKDQLILLIENSTKDAKVNTKKIFDYGYSTKGEGRGIGLDNVNQIIRRYSNLSLVTESKDYRFSQMFKIEYKESV